MENAIIETSYPLSFRQADAQRLGGYLKNRQSVMLIGMKRVGISNFLRFFLYHKDILPTYIADGKQHLFIPIDLNDLMEREIAPFWRLTLKRIVDMIEKTDLSEDIKSNVEKLFSDSIQLQDLFITIDSLRKILMLLVQHDIMPTIFFLRFDRIKDVVTKDFFGNLQGLKDATHQKLSYVFTSYRSLDELAPQVFEKTALSVFLQDMYMKPAEKKDTAIIYETYKSKYNLVLSESLEKALFTIVDGYVQYMQLTLIALKEMKHPISDKAHLLEFLLQDERIHLQSEELWESLTSEEHEVLLNIQQGHYTLSDIQMHGKYLWHTGLIMGEKNIEIFSPLFADYLSRLKKVVPFEKTAIIEKSQIEFTKKEHQLFSLLQDHLEEICEREKIISSVWPEVEELGVSDWAVDRLVARVRSKLKAQNSPFEIQTVKTRGYKLLRHVR